MPDPIFADPRLARLYDPLGPDRRDLDAYTAIVHEFGATSVLDVGCGTGTLACRLAGLGVAVTAVDPAAASLDVARAKPSADSVRWILGDATTLPPLHVDLAMMTGNVAQVFVTDDQWTATLRGVHDALRPGGRFVFETRDPSREAWRAWTRDDSYEVDVVDGVGEIRHWADLVDVSGPLVTFRWTFHFVESGDVLTSDSTLRFRTLGEVETSLSAAGLHLSEVRDAPDRPGLEFVVISERPG